MTLLDFPARLKMNQTKLVMAKPDILHMYLQKKEQQVLDIQQLHILNLYDKIIKSKSDSQFLFALGTNGYMTYIERKNGVLVFTGCNDNVIQRLKEQKVWAGTKDMLPFMYDQYVIEYAKMLLTAWHKKAGVMRNNYWPKIRSVKQEMVYLELTKQERGILTQILRIENKRKALLKKM